MDAATIESSQVFANPDGTFTQEMNAAPVRARKDDGTWAPIDTTLAREAAGSVRSKNTTAGLTFSGGASADGLVTLDDQGHKLRLGWPLSLPEPQLDGSTATYAGVFPDVDLKLTALSSGYTSVLVVKTAEAAKNPALATISMTVSGSGLDIAPTADGGFVARNRDGSAVIRQPALACRGVWLRGAGEDVRAARAWTAWWRASPSCQQSRRILLFFSRMITCSTRARTLR
ncbi:hypothetical protein QFZ22_000739 [Streptomyces canus]|uniref:Uncharacterized protein n=1 Tax=Streptomyces canus TaxID=58343 RepID=A0AAW8F4L8_9ACTN|nr:hypothetical protein [Streptomyces canus]